MIYLTLAYEFMKIGLFAVGGGLATLPFLEELAEKYPWFDEAALSDMIAISESTPGPIGINMATYAGINAAGLLGGAVATLSIITPSIIVVLLVSKALRKFRDNWYVDNAFRGLRPAVTAMIASAGLKIMLQSVVNLSAANASEVLRPVEIGLFVLLFVLTTKFPKVHPAAFIGLAAAAGILFKL